MLTASAAEGFGDPPKVSGVRPAQPPSPVTWYRVHVLTHFGDMPLDAIRQRDVRTWVAGLTAHGLAPATVVKVYQLFAKVMAAAVAAEMLAVSPVPGHLPASGGAGGDALPQPGRDRLSG